MKDRNTDKELSLSKKIGERASKSHSQWHQAN
jgi:hypothetical protein